MKTVTIDEVLSWEPCEEYTEETLQKLAGRRKEMTGLQILALKIPVKDRFWAILKHEFLVDKDLRLFACDCAEHVLGVFERKYPEDKRPRDYIATSRRFAHGQATAHELAAALAAACDAAGAAAGAAACDAALATAGAAVGAAAGDKERAWQVKRLRMYLEAKP